MSLLAIIGDPHPAHMEEALRAKAFYFNLFQFSALALAAASFAIGVKYLKKARIRSVTGIFISTLLISFEVYLRTI